MGWPATAKKEVSLLLTHGQSAALTVMLPDNPSSIQLMIVMCSWLLQVISFLLCLLVITVGDLHGQ